MKFDPANGGARPYPSDAYQWRQFHGPAMAWMFNPWTGTQRTTGDVGSDPQGLLICPPGGQLYAETHMPEARSISDEMMDCVDRLGSEFDSVDPRVWGHLLVYAPDDKVLARARAALSQPAPAPQVPAPVDERAEFEACAPMAGSLFKRRADDPDKYWDGNVQDDWELWQARAALQSPSPKTKGQP